MNEIEVIWKFLDNLDEYVYATDIETDELVYMNRKLLEVYGLQSIDDVKGMKCYEVLQKSSVPCGMCNNDRLCAGKFVEWRYYNPVIDKYMMLKDTLVEDPVTNKKYRIEISIDISEERSQDKMIQKYSQRGIEGCAFCRVAGRDDPYYSGISRKSAERRENIYF